MVFLSVHKQRLGECALKEPSINNVTRYWDGIEGRGVNYLTGKVTLCGQEWWENFSLHPDVTNLTPIFSKFVQSKK